MLKFEFQFEYHYAISFNSGTKIKINRVKAEMHNGTVGHSTESCLSRRHARDQTRGRTREFAQTRNHGCQMAIAEFLESYVFGPSGLWLRYAALQNLPSGNTGRDILGEGIED